MPVDPLSVAGLGLGAVSLAIQLADGLRKGFVFVEEASQADDSSKAFAVRLAMQHQRFEAWCDLSSLSKVVQSDKNDRHAVKLAAKAEREFALFIKYTGPVIVPILLEMNMVISQLSNSADRYSEFVEAESADQALTVASSADADIAGDSSSAKSQQLALKAASLSASIRSTKTLFSTDRTGDQSDASSSHATGNIFKRMLRSSKKAANMKSIRWVIHDAGVCNKKITRVRELNDFLHESLGHVAREKQIERDEIFQGLIVRFESTLNLSQAFLEHRAADASDVDSTLTGSTAVEQPFRTDFLRQAERFRLDVMDATSRSQATAQMSASIVADIEYLEVLDTDSRQLIKFGDGRQSWVEWRPYTEINLAPANEPPEMGVDPDLESKLDRLVSLLKIENKPEAFCVPPCLGYFFGDDNRVAIVYEAPGVATTKTPQSLFSYLGKVEMSLSSRVRFAKVLAKWLFQLHSVRWLHKGIESSSVLFFPSDDIPSLENPFMTGFSYARTASTDPKKATTKPPYDPQHINYVHPDYQGSVGLAGYRAIYDIYSLGIVFIELAYWRPIEEILREALETPGPGADAAPGADRDGVAPSPQADTSRPLIPQDEGRDLISGKHPVLDRVRMLAGDQYYNVVKACLQGMTAFGLPDNAPEADTLVSMELLDAFARLVVEPLQSIAV